MAKLIVVERLGVSLILLVTAGAGLGDGPPADVPADLRGETAPGCYQRRDDNKGVCGCQEPPPALSRPHTDRPEGL